jgi:hypothetical protein
MMIQCEGEIISYHPFQVGGEVHKRERCQNKATIRIFPNPEIDGDSPPMIVCNRCYAEFVKKGNGDYKTEELRQQAGEP